MGSFLLALVAMILVLVVIAVLTAGAITYGVRRSNRINPKHKTAAPTAWVASPGAAARMHRRLRAAVRRSQAIASRATTNTDVARMAQDLETEALAIDDQLAVIARMRSADRRPACRALEPRIREIESLAGRIAVEANRGAVASPGGATNGGLDRLAEELDAIEAARREVDEIDNPSLAPPFSPSAEQQSPSSGLDSPDVNRPSAG